MSRRLAVDEILRNLPRDDAWEFQRRVYGPGTPSFKELREFLATKGKRVSESSLKTWYERNRSKYETAPPELILWQTMTGAAGRRDRLAELLDQNWDGFAAGVAAAAVDADNSKTLFKLLDAIAALDLGTRVASEQLHNLEVKISQEKLVMATVNQVFEYLVLEMGRQGVESLRLDALEAMEDAIADRIALENKFQYVAHL